MTDELRSTWKERLRAAFDNQEARLASIITTGDPSTQHIPNDDPLMTNKPDYESIKKRKTRHPVKKPGKRTP